MVTPHFVLLAALTAGVVAGSGTGRLPAQIDNAGTHSRPGQTEETAERERLHQSIDWLAVAPHLPDPKTGTPSSLQLAGDVLRARRLPEDALDYYRYAIDRGGDNATLLNRIGVTELELRHLTAAKLVLKRAVALSPRSGESWNNLGATEYVLGNYKASIADYRKAVKLAKDSAVYHSNLGTSLFEEKDYEGARNQFKLAVKLDPKVLERSGSGGVEAHIMSAQDRGRFCFEMAKLAGAQHNDEAIMLWLSRATEAGYDIQSELGSFKELAIYKNDARVLLIVSNAKKMRSRQIAGAPVPALPGENPVPN